MSIGENIKRIRKERKLTQKSLGEKCGILETTIRKYELNLLNPKKETVEKIANALEVSPNKLYGIKEIEHFTPELLANNKKLTDILTNVSQTTLSNISESIQYSNKSLTNIDIKNMTLEHKTDLFNLLYDHVMYSDDMKTLHLFPTVFMTDEDTVIDKKLRDCYSKLNKVGKKEAAKRVEELTEIPRYTDKEE